MKSYPLLGTAIFLACASIAAAAVRLASPFGDHMVLQQGSPVPVWGWADPGETVRVEFAGQQKSTRAGADGQWRIDLETLTASNEGRVLTVSGSATAVPLAFRDVLVGEVWICGGQSNMERQLGPRPPQKPIVNWEREVAAANYPQIRQLYVKQTIAQTPQPSVTATWTVCSPATATDFTAVGYFFARDLHVARHVPVGIIHSSWGGTPAEAWTSRTGLEAFPEMAAQLRQVEALAADPIGAKRAYLAQVNDWFKANDPGSAGESWASPGLDTTAWETMTQPTAWEEAGHAGFDGVVWLRKNFDLPASWTGRDLTLRLSAIDDADTTWVNGIEVGATSGWNTPRSYSVPAGVLKPRGNVIAVRVLDTAGNGGIWNPELPFELAPASGAEPAFSLAGPWLVRFSTPLSRDRKQRPPADVAAGAGTPTVLFNGMIAPLIPYAIRGVTFYQGEANADRAAQYRTLFPALIADWRQLWQKPDLPFLFVQIAPFQGMPPEIREAQLLAWQATPHTSMVVTIDCGDATDIHPAHKQPVGARLALAARAVAYGEKLEASGPVYAQLNISGAEAALTFEHASGGLVAKDGPLTGFTIASADGTFHPATATIRGATVIVSSPAVTKPTAVRYGWADVAAGNLFNTAGLPASPFRTDVEP